MLYQVEVWNHTGLAPFRIWRGFDSEERAQTYADRQQEAARNQGIGGVRFKVRPSPRITPETARGFGR